MSMEWKNTKVVVTGAAGFIGSHLVEHLLELGADVTAFVRYNSRNDAGLLEILGEKKKDIRIVSGEIRELETVRKVVAGADVVFHLAALVGIPYSYVHPNEVVEVNTIGTLNVLTAAKDAAIRKVVITSTSEVYGTAVSVPISEKHPKQPQSPYSASKIAADAIALSFYNAFDLPVAVVRPFNTYGPRQSDRAIIPTLISQALSKNEIEIGNTKPTRDFTYVTDTVEGFIQVAESDKCVGQEVNLGSGQEVSIGELAKKVAALCGRNVQIIQSKERFRPSKSEVERLLADNSKVRELTGWRPKVDFEEGLKRTIAWIRENMGMYEPDAYQI
jgi:NAD dependent epimerase/dehydratase